MGKSIEGLEPPEVDPDLLLYWQAWSDLSMSRNGQSRIAWMDMFAWASYHSVSDFEVFKRIIWNMDTHFLKAVSQTDNKPNDQELDVLKRLEAKKGGRSRS